MFLWGVLLCTFLSLGAKLVEYRLGYNYGEVLHDFSGNSRDGVNGDSSTTTLKNTIPTDRGAYFDNGDFQITLPSNDQDATPLKLPPTFTIAAWVITDDSGGILFSRYQDSNNYFYLKRKKLEKSIAGRICISGSDTGEVKGQNSNWVKSLWNLISVVCSGNSMTVYKNNLLEFIITLPGGASSYSESGTYAFYIGSDISIMGNVWYFVITDDSTFQSSLVTSSSSTKCLTSSCMSSTGSILTSYAPATIDPYLGTGFLSQNLDWQQNSGNTACPILTSSCYGSVQMICSCSSGSCIFSVSTNTNICWCPSAALSATTTTCTCASGFYYIGSSCCETSCATCNSGSLLCLTCIASNSAPDATQGCNCELGYYGTKPLTTSNACTACYVECSTCTQASICTACKSSNAYIDATQGCKCNSGYGGVAPLSTSVACVLCNSECSTCTAINLCTTCKSLNAIPDTNAGCKCNTGYYGTAPLTSSTSCIACYTECSTCTQALLCTACKSLNAYIDATLGCKCNSGYWGTAPLTSTYSCTACYSECATCNQALLCLTCKASNAYSDATQGCKCNSGYYGTAPLTSSSSCTACYIECATCNQALLCLTCKASNAYSNTTQGCICNSDYYGTAPLTSSTSCVACYTECSTCTQALLCTTCKSLNAHADATLGCICNEGYWGTAPLSSTYACTACYSECATCSQTNLCITCKSPNASANTNQGCTCNTGYWGTSPLTTSSSCSACYTECATCSQALICISCISNNASPDPIQGCTCNNGSYGTSPLSTSQSCILCDEKCQICNQALLCISCISTNAYPNPLKGCNCNDGYWNNTVLNSANSCLSCHPDCITCEQENVCFTCKVINAIPDTIGCKCIDGYWLNLSGKVETCDLCYIGCKTCSEADKCLTCTTDGFIPDISVGCICPDGYYFSSTRGVPDSCILCNEECNTCEQADICLTCKADNAVPSNVGCICNQGFSSSGSLIDVGSCILINGDCLDSNPDLTCNTCIESNAAPFSISSCKCNAGFYNTTRINTFDACIACNANTTGVDCNCDSLCITCYGQGNYQCFTCKYFSLNEVCIEKCPIGFSGNAGNCIVVDIKQLVIQFLFRSVGTYFDGISGLTAKVVKNKRRRLENQDPITSVDRGVYFTGSSGLEISSEESVSILSNNFEISIWLNPSGPDGILLSRHTESQNIFFIKLESLIVHTGILIDTVFYNYSSINPLQLNTWSHISLQLTYSGYSSLQLTLNIFKTPLQVLTILPFSDLLLSTTYIAADSNLINFYFGFIYQLEIFAVSPDLSDIISSSCDKCEYCPISHVCIPNCRVTEFYSFSEEKCILCPDECSEGCVSSDECSLCADDYCVECNGLNSKSCIKCDYGYVVEDFQCVACQDGSYYDLETESCLECEGLCSQCKSALLCTSCKENSSLNSDQTCECNLGYNGTTCDRILFTATITVDKKNKVTLIFSEALQKPLLTSDIELYINNDLQEFEISYTNYYKFSIKISFTSEILEGSILKILFSKILISEQNSALSTTYATTKLFYSNEYYENQVLQSKITSAQNLAAKGVAAGVSTALGISLLSVDPTSIFNFLNTADILTSVYLFNLDLSPILKGFLANMRVQSAFPNPISYIVDVNEGVVLPDQLVEYGFDSNLLILNSGLELCIFALFIIGLIALIFLRCIPRCNSKLLKATNYYRYGFFLRYWIQSFLEQSLSCAYGVSYSHLKNTTQIVDFSLCILIMGLEIYGMVIFLYALRKRKNLSEISEIEEFCKVYGTFFEEFKNRGVSDWMYYLIFIIRRLTIIVCVVFLDVGVLQLTVYVTFTLSVSAYVIIRRCFKAPLENFYHIINELIISAYGITILFKVASISNYSWEYTSSICMNLIMAAWVLNIVVSLAGTLIKIRNKVKEIIAKYKARRISRLYTVTDTTLQNLENIFESGKSRVTPKSITE